MPGCSRRLAASARRRLLVDLPLRFRSALLAPLSIPSLLEVADSRPRLFQLAFELGMTREKLSTLSFQLSFALSATHQQSIVLRFPVPSIPLQLDRFLLGELNHFAGKRRTCLTVDSGRVG
jgi:hypothetical protein